MVLVSCHCRPYTGTRTQAPISSHNKLAHASHGDGSRSHKGKASKGDIAGCALRRLCHCLFGRHPSVVGAKAAFHQVVACQQNNITYCHKVQICVELRWCCREMVLQDIAKASKHHRHHPHSCLCWSSSIYHWLPKNIMLIKKNNTLHSYICDL